MIYVTKIKMGTGCYNSQDITEIDSVYLQGDNTDDFFKKSAVYDFLKKHPDTLVKVDIPPYPNVIPALSVNNEKYVKSTPNQYQYDNLLDLPRE